MVKKSVPATLLERLAYTGPGSNHVMTMYFQIEMPCSSERSGFNYCIYIQFLVSQMTSLKWNISLLLLKNAIYQYRMKRST